jgi:hypothetical protein
MKLQRVAFALFVFLTACAGGEDNPAGTGGSKASGGTSTSGGHTTASGGTTGTGGNATGGTASGGTTSSGGIATGGTTRSGGIVTGGTTNTGGIATGGTTNTGGIVTGGTTASGGTTTTGGSSSAGGTGGSQGGTVTGGAATLGGSTSSGGATGGKTGTGGSTSSGGATGGKTGGATSAGGSTGTGGNTAAGGSTGSGGGTGTGSRASICDFASGLNVAWVNFANDVPNPNLTAFNALFKNTYAAGGRVIRWWFHTNGSVTPGYNADGTVQKIPQSHIDGVKAILNAAATNKVAVNISLFSFDMAQDNAGTASAKNQAFLTTDTLRQSYIDNYLTDLVKALKGTPGLYSYEIFNEPEGMSTKGWATKFKIDEKYIQMCVNWFADAIHAADPTALVTNGAQTFDYCSGVSGKTNYYSDSALRTVGGKPNGTLDFYEVHYYSSNGDSNSCFLHPASYWGLDKKLVMGEFAAIASNGVAQTDLYTYLNTNGYNGAWAWAYDSDWPWPSMQVPMQNLYNAQKTKIDSCP